MNTGKCISIASDNHACCRGSPVFLGGFSVNVAIEGDHWSYLSKSMNA